jgi:hypothetical protein
LEGRKELIDLINGEIIDFGVVNEKRMDSTEGFGSKQKVIFGFNVRDNIVMEIALKKCRVTVRASGERFGGKGDGELGDISAKTELTKKFGGILFDKHRLLINGSDESTGKFSTRRSEGAADVASTAVGSNGRDIRMGAEFIGSKRETKGGVTTADGDDFITFIEERCVSES